MARRGESGAGGRGARLRRLGRGQLLGQLGRFGGGVTESLVVFTAGGVVLVAQGKLSRQASRMFGALPDAARPELAAQAIGMLGRYFALDAALFWLPVVLAIACACAAVVLFG